METLWNKILGAIFPENCNCIFCGREALVNEKGVCAECAAQIRSVPAIEVLPPLSDLSAIFAYSEITSRPVKRLKYGQERWIARHLSRFLAIPVGWRVELILPVPLHAERERRRGFNQSTLLAKGLSETSGIPMEESLLLRKRNTENQAGLDREARLTNLTNAFVCPDPALVHGKTILLIDDVITTGSTMAECARTLKSAGASRVYGLAVCYQADSDGAEAPLYFR